MIVRMPREIGVRQKTDLASFYVANQYVGLMFRDLIFDAEDRNSHRLDNSWTVGRGVEPGGPERLVNVEIHRRIFDELFSVRQYADIALDFVEAISKKIGSRIRNDIRVGVKCQNIARSGYPRGRHRNDANGRARLDHPIARLQKIRDKFPFAPFVETVLDDGPDVGRVFFSIHEHIETATSDDFALAPFGQGRPTPQGLVALLDQSLLSFGCRRPSIDLAFAKMEKTKCVEAHPDKAGQRFLFRFQVVSLGCGQAAVADQLDPVLSVA